MEPKGSGKKRRWRWSNLSVAFGNSSPTRKDSLRPEGDVANSDRGRTTIGRAVLVVLDEEGPTERKVPGPAVKGR